MTRQILESQRLDDTLEGISKRRIADRLEHVHQNAQRLLQPITVANPYAPKLTFPTHSLPARRDNRKYLGLIKAIALLHQCQREVKHSTVQSDTGESETIAYIDVTLHDIAIANRIAQKVLVKHHDITPQARQLFGLIRKMLVDDTGANSTDMLAFNRRALREYTGWSDWQVRTHLGELVELEYLRISQGKFGKEYVYELQDTHLLEALPGFAVTDVDALALELADDVTKKPKNGNKSPNLEVKFTNLEVFFA